ncbi:MAG: 30S ribosomal protein S13 [Candidatus Vogelbacteria bacterium]|nr:30S ribosomal protein S13 [Candidatus Vogelbacteria bacterium]
MRIAGITLPENKRIDIALTAIYGIGRKRAHNILDAAKIDFSTRSNSLTPDQENKIRREVEVLRIEGDLKREVAGNIKRLKDIKSYRGDRHQRGLPSKGQRTKSNSRTRRGNVRRTMGSGRKKLEKK